MLLSRLLSGHLLITTFGIQFLVTERNFTNAVAATVLTVETAFSSKPPNRPFDDELLAAFSSSIKSMRGGSAAGGS